MEERSINLKSTADKVSELREFFYNCLQPDEVIDMAEWADRYRMLPSDTSSEFGQWKTSRFPFLKKIMQCLSPTMPKCRSVTAIKGCQLGYSEVLINAVLYYADLFPCSIMVTQAQEDAAKEFSKQRLAPSIEACEKLYYKLGKGKSKHLHDSINFKSFPGGFLTIGNGSSEVFTRSKPVAIALADEIESYELNSGDGGSPLQKIKNRQVNFPDRKFFACSTPKIKETSMISKEFEDGSQEFFFIPCPNCNPTGHHAGFMFVIKWDHVHWSRELDVEGMPIDVWVECPSCGEHIEEKKKTWFLEHGEWFSTKDSKNGERYLVSDDVEKRSFQISSLYSPYGFRSWRDGVREWLEYTRTNNVNLLQVFINEYLGEHFTLEGQELSYHHLETRKEGYGSGYNFDVPNGGLVLSAGVDVQDDRLECAVIAWGLFDECWHVDYVVLPGDTSDMGDNNGMTADGQPSVWLLLDQYLLKRFRHQSGVEMPIEVTMVDTGHRGEQVHIFCRNRENRRVFPVKGKDGWGMGFWQVNRKRHQKYGTFDYTAYVDEIKAKVYSLLSIDTVGAGYVHFPIQPVYAEKWFKGLVCETRKTKMVNGRNKLYWAAPPGARNEPLDTFGYAYVARNAYPVNMQERAMKVGIHVSQNNAVLLGGVAKKRRRGSHGGL